LFSHCDFNSLLENLASPSSIETLLGPLACFDSSDGFFRNFCVALSFLPPSTSFPGYLSEIFAGIASLGLHEEVDVVFSAMMLPSLFEFCLFKIVFSFPFFVVKGSIIFVIQSLRDYPTRWSSPFW